MSITLTKPGIGSTNWGQTVNDNWDTIQNAINNGLIASGTIAARPTADASNAGTLYFATDVSGGTLYRSDGSSWTQVAMSVSGSAIPSGPAGGDLTGTYPNPSIANDAVTNAKLANMAQDTIKGRATGGGTGDPSDLTVLPTGCMPALTGDVTNSAGNLSTTIANDAVTNAKLANMVQDTIKGRATGAGTGDPADLTVLPTGCMPALTGDVTNAAGSLSTSIANDAVTNAKLANMVQDTIKGRATGAGTGDPTDLSTLPTGCMPALTGDVTNSAGSLATAIANDAVTNAKLANMVQDTIKGRATGAGTGDPTDLSTLPTGCMPALTGDVTNSAGSLATAISNNAVTAAKIATGTITDTQVNAANKDGTASTPSLRTLGTGAQQACAGNDSRLVQASPTGVVQSYLGSSAPAGWVPAQGGTIGDASSNATVRANADTVDLFTLLYNSLSDSTAAVKTSAGSATTRAAQGTASQAFAAHCQITLPDMRSRSPIGAGQGTGLSNRVIGTTSGVETVTLSSSQIPAHNHPASASGNVDAGGNHLHSPYYGTAGTAMFVTAADPAYAAGVRWDSNGCAQDPYTTYSGTHQHGVTGVAITVSNNTGGGGSHDNMHPWLALNFIIKL